MQTISFDLNAQWIVINIFSNNLEIDLNKTPIFEMGNSGKRITVHDDTGSQDQVEISLHDVGSFSKTTNLGSYRKGWKSTFIEWLDMKTHK